MGLVIVTGDGLEHKYVANAIVAEHDVDAILVCDPVPARSWKTILKRSPSKFFGKAARQVFLRAIGDQSARERRLRRVLGPSSAAFSRPELVRAVGRPKSGHLVAALGELKPDILAIYGTGIIPDAALNLARRNALNMHTGISPEYRGVSCAFWPIRDGRPEMVGATVHECTSEIDGGKVYFRARASLEAEDDLHAIFARAVKTGAEGYVEVVGEALSGELTGVSQDLRDGREFTGNQLGIWAEVSTRIALRRLRMAGRIGATNGSEPQS